MNHIRNTVPISLLLERPSSLSRSNNMRGHPHIFPGLFFHLATVIITTTWKIHLNIRIVVTWFYGSHETAFKSGQHLNPQMIVLLLIKDTSLLCAACNEIKAISRSAETFVFHFRAYLAVTHLKN